MSKNTLSSDFRKVNVDDIDEEHYRNDPDQELGLRSAVAAREVKVRKLIQMGNLVEALVTALESPPMSCKEHPVKKCNAGIVLDVLTHFQPSEIEKAVTKLDNDQIDTLMKYIYRGFEEPTDRLCANLLVSSWGLGSIMLVLTSRKTVYARSSWSVQYSRMILLRDARNHPHTVKKGVTVTPKGVSFHWFK